MRLKHIEITGFRGFSTKQSFDLSSDATIIIGSNGFGKTSLLDAIHWGICGRLDRINGGDEKLISIYSKTGQARVVLTIEHDQKDISITRIFDGSSQNLRITIAGEEYRETSARARLFETVWPEAAASTDGEESLSLAMIRSVYLQQDRIRDFLESASDQQRFDVISELVGAGRLTELQTQLESESRGWSRATSQLNSELEPYVRRVDDLSSLLSKLRQSSIGLTEMEESHWHEWWDSCKDLGVNTTSVPSPNAADASSSLDLVLRQIHAMQDSNRRRQSLIEQAFELVATPPEKPEVSLSQLEENLASARVVVDNVSVDLRAGQERAAMFRKQQVEARELREQKRALAQLAIQLLDEKCPVCDQTYDIAKTRARLLESIESRNVSLSASTFSEDIEKLASKEKSAIENLNKVKRALAIAAQLQNHYQKWESDCRQMISELGVDYGGQIHVTLKSMLDQCVSLGEKFKVQAAKGERLSMNLARESLVSRIELTETELRAAEQELTRHRAEIRKREDTSSEMKFLISQLRDARSKVAIERLSEIEPLLQRIFSRIDPHPTFRVVKFATDIFRGKGRLDAEILDASVNKSSKNPEAILSSSQLNALAVSVFLSFNLALPNLPLQTAILDDPIQSLDEINLLGLVDTLRRIKDRRQLVVSTHDARFGRLMARKLRPASREHTTSVIELSGWKREGPDVHQYRVNSDLVPLRLVTAV